MAAEICQESRLTLLENTELVDGSFSPLSNDFKKDLVSLLKTLPECSLPLRDFRAKYAEHCGKPFSVREHGYTLLKDLLTTLPETVSVYKTEIMIGSNSVPTTFVKLKLSHAMDVAPANASEVSQVPQGSKEAFDTREQNENLDALGRELAVLLNSQPECSIEMKDLFREYKHHFGKGLHSSLKKAGFKKLRDFLVVIPHIVQLVGSGSNTVKGYW